MLAALTVTAKNRIIKNPTVEYTPYWIYVNEIEFAKDATILRCDLRRRPHWWVRIDGTGLLKDKGSDRVWKFLKVESVELGKVIQKDFYISNYSTDQLQKIITKFQ